MGLLQRGEDGCWKRPQNEKTGGGLPGALGCTAQPPHCRKHGRGLELVPGAEPPTGSQPPHPIPQSLARHPAYLFPPPSSVPVLTCPYPCRPGCAPTVRSPLPEHTYIMADSSKDPTPPRARLIEAWPQLPAASSSWVPPV